MSEMHLDPLPLSEATFCILLSLAAGPRHGYAIMQETRALSDGRVLLSTGTLYGALKRLLEQGWIERLEEGEPQGGRPQKRYQLSELGQRIFEAERARMRALVEAAGRRRQEAGV